MADWLIVPARQAHIPAIAAAMREADRREVWASHRQRPAEALRASLSASEMTWTAFVDGSPCLMWGAARSGGLLGRDGRPWLLATPDIARVTRPFLRLCRAYVDAMQAAFPRLENFVHADNALSLRWLRWCGFTIGDVPEVINGEDFYLFWRERNARTRSGDGTADQCGRSVCMRGVSRFVQGIRGGSGHSRLA